MKHCGRIGSNYNINKQCAFYISTFSKTKHKLIVLYLHNEHLNRTQSQIQNTRALIGTILKICNHLYTKKACNPTLPMLCARQGGVCGSGGIGPQILNFLTTWTETRKKVARFE